MPVALPALKTRASLPLTYEVSEPPERVPGELVEPIVKVVLSVRASMIPLLNVSPLTTVAFWESRTPLLLLIWFAAAGMG